VVSFRDGTALRIEGCADRAEAVPAADRRAQGARAMRYRTAAGGYRLENEYRCMSAPLA